MSLLKNLSNDLKVIILSFIDHPHDILNIDKIIKLKNRDYKRLTCNRYSLNLRKFKTTYEFDFRQLYIEILTDIHIHKINMLDKSVKIKTEFYPNKYIVLFLIHLKEIDIKYLDDHRIIFDYLLNKCSYKNGSHKYYKLFNYTDEVIMPYLKFHLNLEFKNSIPDGGCCSEDH